MNTIFRTPLIIIFLFTSFTSINAATITWLGGNAAWGDKSQWDTSTVPTFGDDVIIPSGYCRIYNGDNEGARSVEVQSAGRLYIYNNGTLEITGAVDDHGLHNMGKVYLYGILEINNITQSNIAISANAIRNEKNIFTYSKSKIIIEEIDDVAIHNMAAYSYFVAKGGLWIYSVNSTSILNQDRFYNYGSIDIVNSGQSNGSLIANSNNFRNYSSGVINLNSNIYSGISNGITMSNFENYGEINIENVDIAIFNGGSLINYEGALIDAQNNDTASFFNLDGGTITNHGSMSSINSDGGIFNYGSLTNYNSFTITDSDANACIKNYSTGIINNYDFLYLLGSTSKDIDNDGNITNHYGGYFFINKAIYINAGGMFSNYGFLISLNSNSNNINGAFINNGVIEDNYGQLQGLISNNRVLVAPVTGPMQVGVPYPNILDVGSLIDVSIEDWKISKNGAIAGTYNEVTNEFTPYAAAIGISTIYISIQDLVSGFRRNFTLQIDTPILPFTKKSKTASTRNEQEKDNTINHLYNVNIYPNPTSGNIVLNSIVLENNQSQVYFYNNLGQLVQKEYLRSGSFTQSINFSSELTNGIYFVKILQDGKEVDMKRIQLHR